MINEIATEFFKVHHRKLKLAVDRGFLDSMTSEFDSNLVDFLRPAYLDPGHPQFTVQKVQYNAIVTAARSVVERKHERQKNFKILQHSVEFGYIELLNDMVYIASALDDINFLPVQQDGVNEPVGTITPLSPIIPLEVTESAKPPSAIESITGTPLEQPPDKVTNANSRGKTFKRQVEQSRQLRSTNVGDSEEQLSAWEGKIDAIQSEQRMVTTRRIVEAATDSAGDQEDEEELPSKCHFMLQSLNNCRPTFHNHPQLNEFVNSFGSTLSVK